MQETLILFVAIWNKWCSLSSYIHCSVELKANGEVVNVLSRFHLFEALSMADLRLHIFFTKMDTLGLNL